MNGFRWRDARVELPEVGGDYIVCTNVQYKIFGVVPFSVEHQKFNATDGLPPIHSVPVAYWAELPELPGGV